MSALHGHSLATIAFQPAANDPEGREFIVSVQHQGESCGYYPAVAAESMDVWFEFRNRFPDAVRIEVNPLDRATQTLVEVL